jgi:glycosyltransferase involved in cell wall biosynthesis
MTFNHKNYISDAIEGFLKQETNFPFEILIHDDASSDGTAEIVRQYQAENPGLIRAFLQSENQYSQGNKPGRILVNLSKGKYIALCEGDDYWTDPFKLQKQVEFMEAHPGCTISSHKLMIKYENGVQEDEVFPAIDGNHLFTLNDLLKNRFLKTCALMYRRIDDEGYLEFVKGFRVGDAPLIFYYAQMGYVGYLGDCMAVYRVHGGGVWSRRSNFDQIMAGLDTRLRLKSKLNVRFPKVYNAKILMHSLNIANHFYKHGEIEKAKEYLKISWSHFYAGNVNQWTKLLRLTSKLVGK